MSTNKRVSFPGIARAIVRPTIKTTEEVVKRGEKVTNDVFKFATGTLKSVVSGTQKFATSAVKTSSNIVGDVVGSKRTYKKKKSVSKSSKSSKSRKST